MSFKKSRNLLHTFLAFGSIIQKSMSTENPFSHLKILILPPLDSATYSARTTTLPRPLLQLRNWLQHISVHNVYRPCNNGKLLDATDARSHRLYYDSSRRRRTVTYRHTGPWLSRSTVSWQMGWTSSPIHSMAPASPIISHTFRCVKNVRYVPLVSAAAQHRGGEYGGARRAAANSVRIRLFIVVTRAG